MSFEALKESLKGVWFTSATPFSSDRQSVHHGELANNIKWLQEQGVSNFIPNGNTGEYYALTDKERREIVQTVVETVSDSASVVPGAGGSTKEVINLTEHYRKAGVDGVMIMYPSHTYIHSEGIREYIEQITTSAPDLGFVIYVRGPALSSDTLSYVSEIENVVGVKYAVNDVEEFSNAVEKADDDIMWLNGIAERFAPSYALEGAHGFTTGIGNFAPRISLELMNALRKEDWERAKHLRELCRPFEVLREEAGADNTLAAANNVPSVKFGMELAGLYSGPVREPLVELSEADKQRAREYYGRIKNERIEDVELPS